jgi:hypothetical protein
MRIVRRDNGRMAEVQPVKPVPISQGLVALVDEADLHLVSPFNWSAQRSGNTWYAYRRHGASKQFMHQIIGGFPRTDHINGNGLDNRKINLRPATHVQNGQNMRKSRGTSRYKGVSRQADRQLWKAEIKSGGRRLFLGRFKEEELAARAYDATARSLFGEFAALNFPCDGERSAHRGAAA